MFEEKILHLLKDTKKILDENNITFWPMYGTLLGFIREGRLISHDCDIDISTWEYDYDRIKKLQSEFENFGYVFTFQKGRYSTITIYPNQEEAEKHGIHLDIFFWIKDKDKAVALLHFNRNWFAKIFDGLGRLLNQDYFIGRHTRLDQNMKETISLLVDRLPNKIYNLLSEIIHGLHLFTHKKEVISYSDFKKLKIIKVYNSNYNIPSNYRLYLELTYGKNWKIPDPNYTQEKWVRNNILITSYQIRDKKVRELWVKRWNR